MADVCCPSLYNGRELFLNMPHFQLKVNQRLDPFIPLSINCFNFACSFFLSGRYSLCVNGVGYWLIWLIKYFLLSGSGLDIWHISIESQLGLYLRKRLYLFFTPTLILPHKGGGNRKISYEPTLILHHQGGGNLLSITY